ncbi:hypothetical protein OSB04_011640 [Centaurea solstitialis]|uniref:MULE transposase domain-containing protein n=1 Tax=Centaurea solstitialis TaxID=347529 RepID=A0AA38TMY3_9ASTR|nr:hypothetical protein OSB04_011640 [Centaurea solstitialis]
MMYREVLEEMDFSHWVISKGGPGELPKLERDSELATTLYPVVSSTGWPNALDELQGQPRPQQDVEGNNEIQTIRRSSRNCQEPERYGYLIGSDDMVDDEHVTYQEALSGLESDKWHDAMKAEIQSMLDNQVWDLVDAPIGCKVIRNKWESALISRAPLNHNASRKNVDGSNNLTRLNVKPRDILSTLKERNENNVSSLKTIYHACYKFRMSEQEGRTPVQNVMHILQTKGYDFEYRLNDITNQLEELFFIHPISLKMWQAFPHVVFMDATYKTNKYNLPFLEIVCVASTNKTFSIAFAFMHNEQTSTYTWALTCLKLTINGSFCPRVIVTNRDLALMKACEEVFPQNVLRHLHSVWLDKYADRFVSLWTDRHISFGNSTTNRVKSQHAKLKKHLASRKCDLDKFVEVIENVVNSQDTAIKESLERCKIFLCYGLEELHRSKGIVLTLENCGYQLRTCFGLPCAHEPGIHLGAGTPIPLDSVDVFLEKA